MVLVIKTCLPMQETRDSGSIPGARKIPWKRAWQPTPVFLPRESNGQRSLIKSQTQLRWLSVCTHTHRVPIHLTPTFPNSYRFTLVRQSYWNEWTDWFQIGKGVRQGCILSPCLFDFYAEYITRNTGLEKHKLESRLSGEISITSDMQTTPPLWQKVKRN